MNTKMIIINRFNSLESWITPGRTKRMISKLEVRSKMKSLKIPNPVINFLVSARNWEESVFMSTAENILESPFLDNLDVNPVSPE